LLHLLDNKADGGDHGDNMIVLQAEDATSAGSNAAFLESKLTFKLGDDGQELCLVNSGPEEVCVMMGWERPISESY
jgi:protein arginine N-methyltransferase 2